MNETIVSEVQDGYWFRVLTFINDNTIVKLSQLDKWATLEFENQAIQNAINEKIKKSALLKVENNEVSLSETGRDWLISHSNEHHIDEESSLVKFESDSDSEVVHPYKVSDLKMEQKPLSVFQVLRKISKGEININPEFQRAFVWDTTKQSRLIESILLRIPLPVLYLDATDQENWIVVDGLQRLNTLKSFCLDNSFQLQDLEFLSELNGKKFSELPGKYKILIEDDTSLIFYNLMPGTPTLAKYTIFSRVNTGGLQLTPQEIRHALNQGKSTVLLAKLAKNADFIKVTSGSIPSLRMEDREMILRAIAFGEYGLETYKSCGEMDAFLIYAMGKINEMSEEKIEEIYNSFLESLKKVWAVFGEYSFRKFYDKGGRRGPINKALFEVMVASVGRYELTQLSENKDDIIDHFLMTMTIDTDFIKSISSSTASNKAVSIRFSEFSSLLEMILGE